MTVDQRNEVLVEPCRPEEWSGVVAALDEEFVTRRGRQGSVAERFAYLLDRPADGTVFVVRHRGERLGALVVRRFEWLDDGTRTRGAMIGLVYTRPDARGRGTASQLLRHVAASLRDEGQEFAVLWTGIPGFYARLGWIESDRGLFARVDGRMRGADAFPAPLTVDRAPLAELDSIRMRRTRSGVHRRAEHYSAVPVHAERVEIHVSESGPGGYALVGRAGAAGFVYEMFGGPESFGVLWPRLLACYGPLYVNDRAGSESEQWLSRVAGVEWQLQRLQMWLPFRDDVQARLANWQIGLFDRI